MTNKQTLEIFGQLLNGKKQIVLGKARQSGSSWKSASLAAWKNLYQIHERVQKRKQIINRIFNNS